MTIARKIEIGDRERVGNIFLFRFSPKLTRVSRIPNPIRLRCQNGGKLGVLYNIFHYVDYGRPTGNLE